MQPPELWDYFTYEVPDGAHVRIHPLLDWTEIDIWRYTKRENIPYVPLYLAQERQAVPFAGREQHHESDRKRSGYRR